MRSTNERQKKREEESRNDVLVCRLWLAPLDGRQNQAKRITVKRVKGNGERLDAARAFSCRTCVILELGVVSFLPGSLQSLNNTLTNILFLRTY